MSTKIKLIFELYDNDIDICDILTVDNKTRKEIIDKFNTALDSNKAIPYKDIILDSCNGNRFTIKIKRKGKC